MIKLCLLAAAVGAATLVTARGFHSTLSAEDAQRDSRRFDHTLAVGNSHRLNIKVPVGKVLLASSNGSVVVVHVVRTAKKPLTNAGRSWLQDSKTNVVRHGDEILIEDLPYGVKERTKSQEMRDVDVTVTIDAPRGLAVNLSVSAGSADVKGRFGSLRSVVGAGEMSLTSFDCDGEFNVKTQAGQLRAELASMPGKDSKLSAGVGEVSLTLPSRTNAEVSAHVGIGEIEGIPGSTKRDEDMHLGDDRSAKFGRGGNRISIEVGTGKVAVSGGGQAETIAPKKHKSEAEPEDLDLDMDLDKIDIDIDCKEIDKVVNEALKGAQVEIDKAMDEAARELDAEAKRVEQETEGDSKFEADIRSIIMSALKQASESVRTSMKMRTKHGKEQEN